MGVRNGREGVGRASLMLFSKTNRNHLSFLETYIYNKLLLRLIYLEGYILSYFLFFFFLYFKFYLLLLFYQALYLRIFHKCNHLENYFTSLVTHTYLIYNQEKNDIIVCKKLRLKIPKITKNSNN